MPKLSLFFSLIFGFLIFVEIRRKGYSPYLAIGAVLIGVYAPILLIPIYLFLSFTKTAKFQFGSNRNPQKTLQTTQICPKCGHENPPKATSCAQCNNQLTLQS